jgi:DNA repair protein RadC
VRLRELQISYRGVVGTPRGPRPQITTGTEAATLIAPLLADKVVEHFGVLSLDTRHRVIGWDVVSVGTLDATLVHPREVFIRAILHCAAAIIVAHNHPSGDPTPSADDSAVARRLYRCGEVIGISVLDSVILGEGGRFFSLREAGQLEVRS